jgi:pimeloyl-ACP methyl ester carboxylesterase
MIETTMAYQVHGDGLPVVLLHGAAGMRLSWPAQVRRLPGCRVYALDLPGHGKSTGEACRSIDAIARQVLGWMDSLDLQQAALVGHSMGSAVALQAALTEPGRAGALVLVGTGLLLRVNPTLLELASSQETYRLAMERMVAWSFSRQAPRQLVELAHKRMQETPQAVLQADLLACDAFDIRSRLGEIEAPTLVVCGVEDRMTPLAGAQALVDGLSHARLEVVSAAGHMLMLEQPLAFTAILKAFIHGGVGF